MEDHRREVALEMHLWILVGFVAAYYVGKVIQFWNGREERKTAEAVERLGRKFSGDSDKGGAAK